MHFDKLYHPENNIVKINIHRGIVLWSNEIKINLDQMNG